MLTAFIIATALIALFVLAEVFARVALGLGNPPLWLEDPEIEYLPRPSRSYVRFGKRISYNAYSMRSREFPRVKSDPAELRVLVVGDSIVHGGAQTDQQALATALLEKRLAEALGRPVVVGNISAGSWGPPNCLDYLKRFGLLEADVLVIVLNSADYSDAPTFDPLDDRRPQRRPLLAVQEIYGTYLPRYIRGRRKAPADELPVSPAAVEKCLSAVRELVRMATTSGASVLLAQHLKQSEIETEPEVGYHEIARVARELGIDPIELGPGFARSLQEGSSPYRDGNHPNERGQQIIAELLFEPIMNAVRERRRND